MYFCKNWLVCLLLAVTAYAIETAKEPRFLEDNALRSIMEFTLQSKPPPDREQQPLLIKPVFLPEKESGYQQSKPIFTTYSEFPKQPSNVHINKPSNFSPYPYYNGGYSGFPIAAQSTFPAKPPTAENYQFKPIYSYMPYPFKEKPTLVSPVNYPAPYYFNGYPFYAQMLPTQAQVPLQTLPAPPQSLPAQYYAQHTNHPDSSQRLAVGSPSFIIINPASFPTYHYHDSINRTAARNMAGGVSSDTYSFDEPAIAYDKVDDLESQRNMEREGEMDASSAAQEMEPMFVTAPESGSISASIAVDDEHLLAERILAQARASGSGTITSDPLLELLLQRSQLNRRVQERVAAIYLRNYSLNKK